MRRSPSQLIALLFVALAFVAGCNPPSNPTCSSYIGQAVVNEVSKVQANTSTNVSVDDANDFVEIKILNNSLSASTISGWNVLICKKNQSTCRGGALSGATITTDSTGARYYVIKGTTDVGSQINLPLGTEVALADQNKYVIDYLSIGGFADNRPTACTFTYGTTATSTSTTRRIRRNADGTGNWETVTANEQPATEGLNNTAMPPLVAEWRMDEASWNGTTNEVVATTGTLQGTSKNGATTKNVTPAKTSNQGTCRYGDFDGSNDYVTVPNGSALEFPTAMTFAGWIYPRTVGSGATARGTIMSKGIMSSASSSDFVYGLRLNTASDLIFYQCTSLGSNCTAYSTVTASLAGGFLNKWTHVAVSFHSGYQKIYLNGVEATAASNIGTLLSNTRPLSFGATPNSATSPSTYYHALDGLLDEMRFYNGALTQSQVQTVMNETHLCGPAVIDHFSITPAANTAVTCDAVSVTVAPHSIDHAAPTSYSGTATLGASISGAASGSWELISGAGTFGGGSNGAATYKFASGEASATFRYKNTTAGTVSFTASDGSVSASETGTVDFATAGFLFLVNGSSAAVPTQVAGKASDSGWNSSTLSIRAVTTDAATGVCKNRLPAGTQSIEFAYDCVSPANCSTSPSFTVAGSNSATIPANPSVPTSWQAVNLTFDSNATAPFVTNYNDAGQVQLYVQKRLSSDNLGPAVTLAGNAAINVRPFALRFTTAITNPGGTASTGNKFVAAGSPFTLTLDAVAYDGVDAMDANGFPTSAAALSNNAITPNFAQSNMPLTVNSFTPAAGTAGTLSTTSANITTGGTATLSNISYSDVGSIVLRANTDTYLGGVTVRGDSTTLGRFYPYAFNLQSASLTWNCSTSGHVYMDEPRQLAMNLRAQNAAGNVTQNYDVAKGYTLVSLVRSSAENANAGTDLYQRTPMSTGVWTGGVYTYAANASAPFNGSVTFARSGIDGPFDLLQYGVSVTDSNDQATLLNPDMDASTNNPLLPTSAAESCATTSTCKERKIGSATKVRYGRLTVRSATGSDRGTAIAVPVVAEYYNGSQFTRNEADSCTVYGSSQLNDVDYAGALSSYYSDARGVTAGQWWLPNTDTTLSEGAFQRYPGGLSVTPVAGRTGELQVTLPAPAWLQFAWGNDSCGPNDNNPCGKLMLGQNRGNDRVIFWRERR